MKNKFIRDVSHSIVAQIVSLITGLIISLIVPKYITEIDYSYWQTYLLFATYIGIFHFGIFDGMYLRYGQYNNNEIDKKRYRSQLNFVFIVNIVIALLFAIVGLVFLRNHYRIIVLLVGSAIVIRNVFTYTNYVFQITNRIKNYSFVVITDRLIYLFLIGIFIVIGKHEFYWIVIADLIGVFTSLILGYVMDPTIYRKKSVFEIELLETRENFISGYKLLFANLISLSLIGITKLFVILFWNEETFGKIAFSFNLTNIILGFVLAIGIVLFPTLKRMDIKKVISLYPKVRNVFIPFLFISILTYYPLKYFLDFWLPNYAISLKYLGILMPIVIFEARVTLLTNNYLKVFRREKVIFVINILSLFIAVVLLTIAALFSSIELIVINLLIVLIFRSIVSEIYVSKIVNQKFRLKTSLELLLVFIFVFTNTIDLVLSSILYSASLLIYLFIFRKDYILFIKSIKNKFKE